MQVLIAVFAIIAVASAGFLSPVGYHGVPLLDHNGYQVDTADVAHAKAAHFAAHAEANARLGGPGNVAPLGYASHFAGHYAAAPHIPIIGPNGVPFDTPEVAAGKAANAAAHAEANARHGNIAVVGSYSTYAHGYSAAPVALANGVPHDTPEVAHAKAAHLAAHVEAKERNGDLHAYGHPLVHYRKRRGIVGGSYSAYAAPNVFAQGYTHGYPQHIPVIGANGVPLETPEVVAAKASHAAAHVEAVTRSGHFGAIAPLSYVAAHGVVGPLAYAHQHIPVIGPNGVPLDTPEVAAGKAANAAAHAEAKTRNGDLGVIAPYAAHAHGYATAPLFVAHGVPVDTPEVAHAKAAHFAAHVEAKARNGALVHHY